MGFFADFKKFVMRGNVFDMAVGVIIGGAFGKLSASFVNDIMMPPIGMLAGKVDFKQLYLSLDMKDYASLEEATTAGAPTIRYGLFINTVIDFLLMAFAVFLLVKIVSKLQAPAPAPAPAAPAPPPPTEVLLGEIRDLLKTQGRR